MKIAFFEIGKEEKKFFKEKLKEHNLVFSEEELNEKTVKKAKDADAVCVFIYSNVDKEVLNSFENLKAVITRSTGYDHIDVKECKKKKIRVLNVPFYGGTTVVEHTFALILDLSRKIHNSYERTKNGDFSLEGLRGFELKDKTLGIVGVGNIGKNVARIAKGFGMNVVAYDVKKDRKLAKRLGFKYAGLDNLLKNSDIVTLHVPYNKKTHHLLNSKNIKLMKKNAFLINTSRGAIVDTNALIRALKKGNLGGAGLDVLEEEELIKEEVELLSEKFSKEKFQSVIENHLLLNFDNVIVTPHNAFNSEKSSEKILNTTLDNVKCIENKKKCKNEVKL